MRTFRRGLAALTLASATVLVPTSAFAGTASGVDPTGDVSAANDITGLSVSNSLATVGATITLAQPVPTSTDPSWIHNGGTRALEVLINANDSASSTVFGFVYDGTSAAVVKVDTDTNEPVATALCSANISGLSGTAVTFGAAASCFGVPARIDAYGIYGLLDGEFDIALQDANNANDDGSSVTAMEPGGQYLLGLDGGVFTLGDAPFYGSTGDKVLNEPVVSMAKNKAGAGYWFVASDGGVFTFGPNTNFFGSMGGKPLNQPVVGMASTPSGNGYWLVAADGGIFTFGDATFYGSTGDKVLNAPVIGMEPTSTGHGYYLYAADGGVFTFGDAAFKGSTGSLKLNEPILDMTLTNTGNGYWFVAADGGVFSFGDAQFYGSAAGQIDDLVATAILPDASGNGYRIVLDDGEVANFGAILNYGDLVDQGVESLNAPIIGAVNS